MAPDDVFVIAVKRERRDEVPAEWVELVRGTSGVTVMGTANPGRMQVRASPEAISRIRAQLADYLNIEKLIPHRLS
jgi:hypothetical protein